MAFDDSKLNYSSQWDIDQLVAANDTSSPTFTNRIAVPAGTSAVVAIPSSLPDYPEYTVQFQISGLSRWYSPGGYSTDGTLAGYHQFSVYVQNRVIYITTDTPGIAKYFIWADKVNY